MSCQVVYNKNKKIERVNRPDGKESTLFNEIASLPHVKTLEEALDIFKGVYSKVYYNIIGEKAAFNKKPLLDKLKEAKKLRDEGNTIEGIYKKTGWFMENNQWKYLDLEALKAFKFNSETPLKIGQTYKLNEILDDDSSLFTYFPNIGGVLVQIKEQSKKGVSSIEAAFDQKENTISIYLPTELGESYGNKSVGNLYEVGQPHQLLKAAFLHEIQHVIQYIEDFPIGGNPSTVVNKARRLVGLEANITFLDLQRKIVEKLRTDVFSDADKHILIEVLNQSEDIVTFNSQYRKLFGEVEDRLVEEIYKNAPLTEDFNYATAKANFLEKEGINENEQFVIYKDPTLNFSSDKGEIYSTFKDALDNSSGGDMEIIADGNTIATVSSNTNVKELGGFINYHIKAGTLSDTKVVEDGESFFVSKGEDAKLSIVNDIIIKEEATLHLGKDRVKVHKDGRIELKEAEEFSGLTKEEIRTASDKEIKKQLGEIAGESAIINNALKEFMVKYMRPKDSNNPLIDEKELKLRLLNLLSKLGVEVTSIAGYVKKYQIKNGVEPSATALADIANKVVAFSDGSIPLGELTEEVAHFIVEAWNEQEIENLLRNINKTDTYVEFAEEYRRIYTRENPNMNEQEIENLVRKEILGKELVKSLQSNFSTERAVSETHKNIIEKIKDFFIEFFNKIIPNITEQYKKDLQSFTESVEDLLIQENVEQYLNVKQLENKKIRLYSNRPSGNQVVDRELDVVKDVLKSLQEQEKALRALGVGSSATLYRLKAIEAKIANAMDKKSVVEMVSLANKQSRYVEQAVNNAKSKGQTLNNEEQIVLHNLRDYVMPMLAKLKDILKNDPYYKGIDKEIDVTINRVVSVQGAVDNIKTNVVDKIIDNIIKRHEGLTEEHREMLRKAVNIAEKDTQMLYSVFGQITHAQDPLLNILGVVISDLNLSANQRFLKRSKDFQQNIKELGFKENDLTKFYDEGGWMVSLHDYKNFTKDLDEKKAQAYKTVVGSDLSIEDIVKKTKRGELEQIKGEDKQAEYQRMVSEAMQEIAEMPFNEKYYKEKEDKYASIKYEEFDDNDVAKTVEGVSQETITALRLLSIGRSERMRGVKKVNGVPVFTRQDKFNIDALNLQRREMKSFYDNDGSLKQGIKISKINEGVKIDGVYYKIESGASKEARIAFEMHLIDKQFIDSTTSFKPNSLSDDFLYEMKQLENSGEVKREDILDFFLLNTNVSFSDDFWENSADDGGFVGRVEEYLSNNEDEALVADLNSYKELLQKRKQILKKYQDSKNAMNIMAEEIDSGTKRYILSLSDDIDAMYKDFSKLLTKSEKGEDVPSVEVEPNQSYFDRLKDENINTDEGILKFTLEHLSPTALREYREFDRAVDALVEGKPVPKYLESMIKNVLAGEDLDALPLKIKYAQRKLAPYYKSFAPTGTKQFYDRLKNSTENVSDIVREEAQRRVLKMTNHYLYYENRLDNDLNENYIKDFEGGYSQPKLSKYTSSKFVEMFSPLKDSEGNIILDENGEITPSASKEKLYALYRTAINFQKNTLESLNEKGSHNVFFAPQVSKTMLDKVQTSIQSGKRGVIIKEWIRELTNFRIDELLEGETNQAGDSLFRKMGIRVVPKYFLRPLEESAEVTNDLFYSMTAMAQQAELHRARKEKFSEFTALKDAVLNDERYTEGKAAKATNTWKMFESYMDANLFGIHEIRNYRVDLPILGSVDVAKIASSIHDWVRHKSLAYNLVVPITSWATAKSQMFMERYIQQYIDKDSYNLAIKRFNKIATPAIKESLEIDSTSELSVLGEYTRIFDLGNRFKNSKYDTSVRVLGKASYILHTAGNFEPLSKAMLSSLYGHRLVGEGFIDFTTFSKNLKNQSKSDAAIRAEWGKLKDKAFYSYMNVGKTTVTYDFNRMANDMGKVNNEQFREDFDNLEKGILAKISKIVERIDGQIKTEERTYAQRHFLLKFMTTHKGWLSIAAANRFKKRHLNLQTGMQEEGSYISAYNFMANLVGGGIKDKKMPNFKEFYNGLSDAEKINLKRVGVEMGVLNLMFVFGLLMTGYADDDENKDLYALQVGTYIWERLVNETSSSQLGVISEIYSSAKEPVVGLQTTVDGFKFWNLFNTDVVDRGQYAGLNENAVYAVKQIPGAKQLYTLLSSENMYKQRQSYNYFNSAEDFILAGLIIDED